MKELLRSAKEGRWTWSKSGESTGKRSVPSRARNSGEEKKAEELEKRPPADILVLSSYRNHFCSFLEGHLQTPKSPTNQVQDSDGGESARRHPGLD